MSCAPSRGAGAIAASAVVVACVLLAPSTVRAAACCMSATTAGVGRLLNWEKAALGTRLTIAEGLGVWDDEASWRHYDDDRKEREVRSEIWALARIQRRTSAWMRIPSIWSHRTAGELNDSALGLGDIAAGLRYEAIQIGERARAPGVALIVGAMAPTGRSADEAETTLAADVTSRGGWVATSGVSIERTHVPVYGRLDLSVAVPLPHRRQDTGARQRYGVRIDGTLTAGVEIVPDVVVSSFARAGREAPLRVDGERLDGSERVDLGVGATLSWRFRPHWTAQASLDSGVFVDQFGMNQNGQVRASGGLRYGFF